MNTQDSTNPSPTASQARTRPAENDQVMESMAAKGEPRTLRAAVANSGRPLGWIERTLIAVDGKRVFIDVSDPGLREELVAANEARHHDVIAASNREALLEFMARLPIPIDAANDIVIAQEDYSGTEAIDLRHELEARGWSIPVLTVSPRARLGEEGGAS
jgi:hypothetical protein